MQRIQRVAFIIADKPKFGSDLLNLIYRGKTSGCKIKYLVMFLPDCFEEVVCEIANDTDALEDMNASGILEDMRLFYNCMQVSDRSRCNVVDLNAIDISMIQPQENGGIQS